MDTSEIAKILNIKDEFLTNHEFRRYFRFRIRESLQEGLQELPSVPSIAMGPAIDENTITQLNELMTSDEKRTFLSNILHFKNIDFNIYYLILNSSDEVRKHIMEILTHSVLGMSTLTFHFYDIANIYLYILANSEEYNCKDILQYLKKGMLMYDSSVAEVLDSALDLKLFEDNLLTKKIIKEDVFEDKIDILDSLKLKTDEQLEENKNNFFQQIENQEQESQENKKLYQTKIFKIIGFSVLFQIVLVSLGLPPFSRIVTKTIKTLFDSDN